MNSKPFPSPQGRVLGALTHLTVVAATVVLFSGCVVSRARPARSVTVVETAPPPQRVVVVRDPPGPGNTVVIVKDAPPPPRREVVVERSRPSTRHVWIGGYWRHDGRAYIWAPGRWELPPRARVIWVKPRWELRGGTYVFVDGAWR